MELPIPEIGKHPPMSRASHWEPNWIPPAMHAVCGPAPPFEIYHRSFKNSKGYINKYLFFRRERPFIKKIETDNRNLGRWASDDYNGAMNDPPNDHEM